MRWDNTGPDNGSPRGAGEHAHPGDANGGARAGQERTADKTTFTEIWLLESPAMACPRMPFVNAVAMELLLVAPTAPFSCLSSR